MSVGSVGQTCRSRQLAHVLCSVARYHKDRFAGRDDHKVAYAERSDSHASALEQAVARIERDDVAIDHVSTAVVVFELVESVPAADVRPSHIDRDHRDARAFSITA